MSQVSEFRRPQINAMHELHGKALWTAITGIMLGLLLSSLDQTVVGTALLNLADLLADLRDGRGLGGLAVDRRVDQLGQRPRIPLRLDLDLDHDGCVTQTPVG